MIIIKNPISSPMRINLGLIILKRIILIKKQFKNYYLFYYCFSYNSNLIVQTEVTGNLLSNYNLITR